MNKINLFSSCINKSFLVKACEEEVQLGFLCPCKFFGDKHLAISTRASLKHKMVVCSKDGSNAFCLSELGANAEVWLQESKQAGKNNLIIS